MIPPMQKTIITYVDDLTGEPIEEKGGRPVKFALDGQEYEIDLSDSNIGELNSVLAPYIKAGRKIAKKGRPRASAAPAK
jgi:hypothetical protein